MSEELIKKEQFEELYKKIDAYKRAYKEQKRVCGHLASTIENLIHELDNCVNIITNYIEEKDENKINKYYFPETIVGDKIEFENGEVRIVLDNNVTLDKYGITTGSWIKSLMPYRIIGHVNINDIFGRSKV